jgi:GMP synthase-like glutamine amidotransferase
MSHLLVIQHVPHERLGTLEPVFREAGWSLSPLNSSDRSAAWPTLETLSGIVVMGGPQSVYEQAKYPYLTKELALLRDALQRRLPILGVCLGAQLVAAALGAKVMKNPQKEVGWYPLMREPGADGDPLCEPFGQTETVFQWHGDTFTRPNGATRLFSSPLCQEQAFRYRDNVYGLQFHLEVTEAMIRAWMRQPANRVELAQLNGVIDPLTIRRQNPQHIGRLQELGRHVARAFCALLPSSPSASRRPTHASRR